MNTDNFMIISDPLANRSACAVDFKTGSMDDPASKPGLSHLLEHVISSEFSDGRIGVFNGSTGYEHTNFRFEIDHRSFANALKTFASSLNSPYINKERVQAEKYVLNSEFEKSRYDQTVLRSHIMNMTNAKGHPLSKFHYGNIRTLKNISAKDVKDLFNENYFFSNSKVAIISALPYEEILDAVNSAFKDFRDREIDRPEFDKKIFKGLPLPQMITADLDDSLIFCFEIDRVYDHYRTKPHWILNYLINTKREGSFSNKLKELGLATDVLSSVQPFSFSSLLYVEFKPTRVGLLNPERIMEEFFSYLSFIKGKGYPKYIFEEQKDISGAGFKFREQNEGIIAVKDLARLMHYYPVKDAARFNDIIFDYSEYDFNTLLNSLTLDNLKVLLCRAGLKTATKDPYYGVHYKTKKLNKVIKKKRMIFRYPKANRFIMHDPVIHGDDAVHNVPYRLINDERGEAWFLQNNVLKLPMSYINLLISTPVANKDPFSKLKSIFYSRLVSEMLEEVLDEAGEAGLSFGIDRDDRGILLFFSGYSQKMSMLFKEVISTLKIPKLKKDDLDAAKKELKNDYLALKNGSSYSLAQYFKYQFMHERSIPYTEYIDLIDKVSVNNLKTFVKELYENIFLEGHIYGDISPKDISGLYDLVFDELSAKPLVTVKVSKDDIVRYEPGKAVPVVVKTNSLDKCWSSFYQFGERTIRLSAIMQLGHMFLVPFFFESVRSKKQLGYLAETRIEFFEKVLGLSFVILSDDNSPDKLAKEAEAVLSGFPAYLKSIPKDRFENNKRVLVERVNKNNRTLEDWMNDVFLTSIFNGDAMYAAKLSTEIASLSAEELCEVFQKAFDPATRARLSVCAGPQ